MILNMIGTILVLDSIEEIVDKVRLDDFDAV